MDHHTYYYVQWERMNDIILNTWIWGNKYVIKFFEHIFWNLTKSLHIRGITSKLIKKRIKLGKKWKAFNQRESRKWTERNIGKSTQIS